VVNAPAIRSLFPEPTVPGVEVSLCVQLRGLTVDLDADRARRVRQGYAAPETADDHVALAASLLDDAPHAARTLGAAARHTTEAERLGAAAADVALLRSVHAEACRRAGIGL
jgi:hypothetical protein